MNAETLLALAARCEREEPSFTLRVDLARAILGWREVNHDCHIRYVDPDGKMWWALESPDYTTSLDAAVTLVPGGWNWSVEFFTFDAVMPYATAGAKASVWRDSRNPRERFFNQQAPTPTLALCAAALRARAALSKAEGR